MAAEAAKAEALATAERLRAKAKELRDSFTSSERFLQMVRMTPAPVDL